MEKSFVPRAVFLVVMVQIPLRMLRFGREFPGGHRRPTDGSVPGELVQQLVRNPSAAVE